jgi:outer membrane protein assembly factor BamB
VLVDSGLVYAQVGGPGRAVMAFDAATGAEKWKSLTTKDIGYAPPVIVKLGGTKQLVVWLSEQVAGMNPTTGEVYWTEKHPAAGKKQMEPAVTVTTPKVAGDRLYISSFYDGTLALQFASGKKEPTIAWRANDIYPKTPEKLPTLMSSLIVKDGHIYGIEGMHGKVVCLEEATGKEVWRDPGLYAGKETLFGTAFWVEAGENVYSLTDEGDLVIHELSPKGYKEKGRAKVIEATHAARGRKVVWAHPAFANGKMIVRNDREMICVDLTK